jgi:signal transduction histidine kinase
MTRSVDRPVRWPLVLFGAAVVVYVCESILVIGYAGEPAVESIPLSVALAAYAGIGALIVTRRPRNTIGLIFLFAGVGIGVVGLLSQLGNYAFWEGRYRFLSHTVGHLLQASWVLAVGPLLTFVPLLFPDGALPSRRWRLVAWAAGILIAVSFLTGPLAPLEYQRTLPSGAVLTATLPPPIDLTVASELEDAAGILVLLLGSIGVASIASVFVRAHRARGDERAQLRWLGLGVSGLVGTFLVIGVLSGLAPEAPPIVFGLIVPVAFLMLPVSAMVGILRYRLYDIDVVIKKTVVFAIVTGCIAVVYVAIVAGVGALVGARSTPFLSAFAAAVVALVFQPLRARARQVADRLVYGKRATPYEVLAAFGDQLAGSYAADDVLPRTARILGEGVGAERARVWLLVGDELREVASWSRGTPADGADDHLVEVRHRAEPIGALSVTMPANDPMDPAKEKLVADLAAHAGLVLSNVRLTEELRIRLDDLRAAQKRLVTAQDAERKRLERNIHDGAQQQLVALAVKLKLAENLFQRDPEAALRTVAALQGDTAQALEDLRDLARGIYPPLLADEGLEAALTAQARRAVVPVEVDVTLDRRFPPEVEAAVYFSCLEALQNVAKYADASRTTVRIRSERDRLTFEISDDGRGFDPASNGYGSGLQGIADRLGALDGAVEVRSAPGAGTAVHGWVPMTSPAFVAAGGSVGP